jgi:hypothetical protein
MTFKCRVCGSNHYNAVHEDSSLEMFGSHANILYYKCVGCSVLFDNPVIFSVG